MTIEQRQTSPLVLKDVPEQQGQLAFRVATPVGAALARPRPRKPPQQWIFRVATLGMLIILLGGCVALLWQMQQGSTTSHAVPAIPADVSVVGPPSLSAATVNAIFTQYGSSMAGTGTTIETLSRRYNIDDAFALGVWWTETNDGMAGVGSADHNPGSVRGSPNYPSAWDGYTIYPSYTAAISDWFNILNGRYISSGLTTVFSIARPYVGTSSYQLWAGKVIALIYRYRGIAPPPPLVTSTLTPRPKPKPKPVPTLSPAMVVQKHRQATLLPREADFAYVRARQGLDTEAAHAAPAQIAPPVTPVASTQSASLSPTLLNLILFFGLLAALLIALYAQSIGRGIAVKAATNMNKPARAPQSIAILSPVDTEELFLPVPASETTTGELKPLPVTPGKQFTVPPLRPMYLPARPRQTDALPRRTLFLPPQPTHSDSRVLVTVGAAPERSAGLLSRYKEEKQ